MLKKTITYTDYNDNERAEDFYFNMTKPELFKFISEYYPSILTDKNITEADYEKIITKMASDMTPKDLISLFEKLILDAYGIKSDDGKKFIKNEEIRNEFLDSPAYSELFMELLSKPEEQQTFFLGIMPRDIQRQIGSQNVRGINTTK